MRKPLFSFNNIASPLFYHPLCYHQTCLVGGIINFKRHLSTFACCYNDSSIYLTEIHWMLLRLPLKMELDVRGGGLSSPSPLLAPSDSTEHTKYVLLDNFIKSAVYFRPATVVTIIYLFIYILQQKDLSREKKFHLFF